MKQKVVDDVQDHSILGRVGGDLEVMVNQGESVHGTYAQDDGW